MSSRPPADERRCQVRLARKFPASSTEPGKLRRNGGPCVRQNRVVLAVVATVKLPAKVCASPTGRTASSIRRGEGGQKEVRLPGEHGISRPTIAQGRPSDLAPPVCCCAVPLRVLFAQRTAGAMSAPDLPCALLVWRVERPGKTRAKRAARMRRPVCNHTRAVIVGLVRICAPGRAILYSRGGRDRIERPRRHGSPTGACRRARRRRDPVAGNDNRIWSRRWSLQTLAVTMARMYARIFDTPPQLVGGTRAWVACHA